jgi:hypothetical protein
MAGAVLTISIWAEDIKMSCPFADPEWNARGGHTHRPDKPDDWPCFGNSQLTVADVLRWLTARAAVGGEGL